MKRFEDLSLEQQETAIECMVKTLVKSLLDGSMDISLKNSTHNRVMHRILEGARKTKNLDRFYSFTQKSKHFKEKISDMAESAAISAWYPESTEYIVFSIAENKEVA